MKVSTIKSIFMCNKQAEKILIILNGVIPSFQNSHHADVEEYVRNICSNEYHKIESGYTNTQVDSGTSYFLSLLNFFKVIFTAAVNCIKIIRAGRSYQITVFSQNDDLFSLYILLAARKLSFGSFSIRSRFICTRDSISLRADKFIIKFLFRQISQNLRIGDVLSAETLEYSEYLSKIFNIPFSHIPYPPIDLIPEGHESNFERYYCVSLGSARIDKGFEKLPALVRDISKINPTSHFVIQAPLLWKAEFKETLMMLNRIENVTVLPGRIESDIQKSILSNASLVLLPYDPLAYTYRGSAFCMRATYLGKLILATKGTSMANEAKRFGMEFDLESSIDSQMSQDQVRKRQSTGKFLQIEIQEIWKGFLK